jgi:hypothetical protein
MKSRKKWVNDLACTFVHNGKTKRCFAKDMNRMKLRLPDAVYRAFYLQTTMIMDDLSQISNNEWYGVLNTLCGKRIQYRIIDRQDRIKEAARLLGQIGGQAGRGKKKVRGDSNYYQLLRLKGLEKRRKKPVKT